MTIIEKILSNHSNKNCVSAGEIIDVKIDARVARDFGGANVVKNIKENNLNIEDAKKTFFTFDTNPTGSDQKYATNQQICRVFARDNGIKIYDINNGIGTHTLIEDGLAYPGSTAVSTDSHANILGSVCAFGQGMGDKDIAVAFSKGKVWFKVPKSVKININGKRPEGITAKDVVLNLLSIFGANKLLGFAVEIYGEEIDKFSLDERMTIASMATEMGAITLLFVPNEEIIKYCESKTGTKINKIYADKDAVYEQEHNIDFSTFKKMVSRPGEPHDSVDINLVKKTKIDSAFIGSCTNGRIEDLEAAANVLKNKKVAPGVMLKIVPATDKIWQEAMTKGYISIFKKAGALFSNAGCAGCAAGQVGQNGPGEITISTGNRNFPGKQGKGEVYLASPEITAASAVAGYITTPNAIPIEPAKFIKKKTENISNDNKKRKEEAKKLTIIKGRVWLIEKDNIDTDMIFHNRYLSITDINEMGQYTFDNLEGFEDFSKQAKEGDIIITGKNFGSGSSRQQAVDCFKALGIQIIIAQSFGAIYERNAINAAMPIITFNSLDEIDVKNGDSICVNIETGEIENLKNNKKTKIQKFSEVQMEIYQNGGVF